MIESESQKMTTTQPLCDAVHLDIQNILNPDRRNVLNTDLPHTPVLVVLAAGKGTRFGQEPKCIQPVRGMPLALRSINEFRRFLPAPVLCLVGHRCEDVSLALGSENLYVRSTNPTGGTAYAAFEALSVPGLLEKNPLLIITMGDRIVPASIYRHIWETHLMGNQEAALTFLTAHYQPPKNRGKGRVLRDGNQRVIRIIEERDIAQENDGMIREALLNLTEGNCPLYVVRAASLYHYLKDLQNNNAQGQYYLTDLIEIISQQGGEIRTITTTLADPVYDLLCCDVTQPKDLALLEGILEKHCGLLFSEEIEVEELVKMIAADRPAIQVQAIGNQLAEMMTTIECDRLEFEPDRPIGIGISGGRLRIAFMHPDMARFFGPAWQTPIGAGSPEGNEQIVVLVQNANDRRIHLYPLNPKYRENINFIPSDNEAMYPGEEISDLNSYEEFGTRMSENLLLSLGYFSDEELEQRRKRGQPLPPSSLWVGNSMRRPFALVGNAIASLRTLREGNLGVKVQNHLGRSNFEGLRLVSSGNIPQGGFASSSAVTVATKNAINALFDLCIPPDLLVHLACQAEYGTGVRAGSLDQATEQKGKTGQGTLISSNPKDNYKTIGVYPVPTDRIQILFPYSVERDRSAWQWSWGMYGEVPSSAGPLTTSEMRKLTGKAAEIGAILIRLPLELDFFRSIEHDLVTDGLLSHQSRIWICSVLRQIPLLTKLTDLRAQVYQNSEWYVQQIKEIDSLDQSTAQLKTETLFGALFAGWREPLLRRTTCNGEIVEEHGIPLRAVIAYLFGEVARNFYLIHHPEEWIEYVSHSQRGDRCVDLDPDGLPSPGEMEKSFGWEQGLHGPILLNKWLEVFKATPFDYNRGLDDESLSENYPPEFHHLEGGNFFRGLAVIDLAEAMLKRAFGQQAVAVRVNAAGQGDYFQVHVDKHKADPHKVKQFLQKAFYHRFGLSPDPEFVEIYPGGGAVGIRLQRYDSLPYLVQRLRTYHG